MGEYGDLGIEGDECGMGDGGKGELGNEKMGFKEMDMLCVYIYMCARACCTRGWGV